MTTEISDPINPEIDSAIAWFEALKGASVQINQDCLDPLTGNLHMWAGLHGTLTGANPFGAALIAVGDKTKTFERDDFTVTAPAAKNYIANTGHVDAVGAEPGQRFWPIEADAQAVRLVTVPPLQAINSRTNPRRRRGLDVDSLRTLADSITAHGLVSPILVRPLPASRVEETSGMDPRPAYEVVAGERRWRACQLAELPTMPMFVREMSDQAVLEMQLVENIEREDLDPMEEAEGFALLREKLGYTVEQIADKMGKGRGPSYVRKRMKLLDLTPESREAMYDGTLQLSTGLLVARYPAEKQAAAIKHIAGMATRLPDGTLVPAPFRDVSLALYRKFATILKTAAFDTTDPGLVLTAGPCTLCSKRTRAHEDLFAEATDAGEDSCLDSTCWQDKKTAHVQRIRADAQARGLQVLDESEALKVAPSPYSSYRSGYTSLTDTAYTEVGDDGKERVVTYGDALRAQGRKAPKPVVLINPHTAKAEELIPDDVAPKLLPKKVQEERAAEAAEIEDGVARRQAQQDATPPEVRALRRQDVMRAIMFRLFDAVRTRERTTDELRLIAEQFIAHDNEHEFGFLEQYMDWDSQQDGDPAAYLREKLAALDAQQLAQVITMAAMEGALNQYGGRYEDEEDALAFVQAQGIDVLAVRDKVDEDLQRQQAAAAGGGDAGAGDGADDQDPDLDADVDADEQEGGAA